MKFRTLFAALLLGSCFIVQEATALWWGGGEPAYTGRSDVTQVRSKARLYRLIGRYNFSVVYFYDSSYSARYKLNKMTRIFAQLSLDDDFDGSEIKFLSMDLANLGPEERAELRKDLELGRAPSFTVFRFEQWSNKDVLKGMTSQSTLKNFIKRRLDKYKKQKEEREEEEYYYPRYYYRRRPYVRFGYGYSPYYHHYGYPYHYGHHGYGGSGFSIGFGF